MQGRIQPLSKPLRGGLNPLNPLGSASDLNLFVVLRRVQQPGSYCDG